MNPKLDAELDAELAALAAAGRLRALPDTAGPARHEIRLAGRPALSFCSNDYLGLAGHRALTEAALEAAVRSGFGGGAARLVAGDRPEHRELEAALAAFVGQPAAALFPTGYQANLGVFSALAGPGDLVVSDAANHASLIDGIRLSRATIAVYPHRDAAAAAAALATSGGFRRRFLVTESLFSMDGDVAPLAELDRAARAHHAVLVVDEAHALGVLGPGGRGLCAEAGVVADALVGTLGKALGAAGGFVAGSSQLIDIIVNKSRTFIYTTALPPPVAAAARAALAIAAGPDGAARRVALFERLAQLRDKLSLAHGVNSPIIPILMGNSVDSVLASQALRERGVHVQAIRPPTVPDGTARLRITLSAAHSDADVARLGDALLAVLPAGPRGLHAGAAP